jgi:replicative DNA helicase
MLRPLPHNLDAERGILGAILVDNDVFHRVSDYLAPEHFYDPFHARLYEAVGRIIKAGKRATPAALKGEFAAETAEIGQLVLAAPMVAYAGDFARLVYEMAARRKVIGVAEEIIAEAMSVEADKGADHLIEFAEVKLAAMAERGKASDRQLTAADATLEAVSMIAAAYARAGGMAGLSTGFRSLDAMTGGLSAGDLIVLAGRPSMGKTALAVTIAHRCAAAYLATQGNQDPEGAPVGFFSLEMSAAQLMLRVLAAESGIPVSRLRRGYLDETALHSDYERVERAAERAGSVPLYFDQQGGISIAQLCARARRMKRQRKIGLLVVDYLQLLSGTNARANRVAEITEITTALKSLAKELNIPVLALSQLSRQVEQRDDKRPQLSDLRESGSIEQDADVVMFVFREEYYIARRAPRAGTPAHAEWESELTRAAGKAEILIEKQRQGPTGTVHLRFDARLTKFSDPDDQNQAMEAA